MVIVVVSNPEVCCRAALDSCDYKKPLLKSSGLLSFKLSYKVSMDPSVYSIRIV